MRKLVFLFLAAVLICPTVVSAHGIGQVYALPVPLKYYLLGAGLAVAFSFFVVAIFLNKIGSEDGSDRYIAVPRLASWLTVLKAISIFLLLLTVATGVLGSQNFALNFTPVFFWIYFLIGMGVLSLFVGNIWDKLNPWKIISDWVSSEIKPTGRLISGLVGVVLILALFWLELVSGWSFVPRILGLILVIYTLFNLIMGLLYANWYKNGELFSVLFGFIGTLAHFRIGEDNKSIIIVNESKKLAGIPAPWWVLGVASVLLAGASFDSLRETMLWFNWLKDLHLLREQRLAQTVGLLLSPLPFLLSYFAIIRVVKLVTGNRYRTMTLAKQFVWSLIPIAFGYTLAHNFSLFIVTAPKLLALISDPFGFGWNLFGTAGYIQKELLLGAEVIWFVEIGFIILAHVAGVVYAHVLALNIFKDPKLALKSQYPMILLMVGYTIMTLWLISQPLVVAK